MNRVRPTVRTILHVDLDAFFAAVAQRDDPELRGNPVLVGGSGGRGVVAAASYEARRFGIHSAMPMVEAMRLCPQAIVVGHHWRAIEEASQGFFKILRDFSPEVESLSVDEAFVDVTRSRRLLGTGEEIARSIRARVKSELGLVASAGVAPTKFVAKIASDIDKPDGLRVVSAERLLDFLQPLPVSRLWGVGPRTQERLKELGLVTIGDVATYPEAVLVKKLGASMATHIAALSRGSDPRPVVTCRGPVTISHEQTFERDISDPGELEPYLLHQADRVAARLRGSDLRAQTVVLKIKHADFRLISRRRRLPDPSCDGYVLGTVAVELLRSVPIDDDHGKRRRVRLCGVGVTGLESRDEPRQLTLDEGTRARGERLGGVLDEIQERFGTSAIGRAAYRRNR